MEQKQVVNISQTGPDMTLRTGAAPQIYNYQGFEYAVTDRQSFVAAVLKFGSKQNTVIACDEKDGTVEAVLDKTVETRQHDKVFLRLMHSDELRRWEAILDKPMDHKTFVKFLERQANPALDSMIAATKQLRFVTQMTGDFSFDDNNNYNFVFKVGDAEGTARLPATIDVIFKPVLENGMYEAIVTFEIELKKPTNEREKPTITVTAPRLQDAIKAAIKAEAAQMKCELEGFLVLSGAITK